MKVTKIVLTGGPCAGKTTGMNWIKDVFTRKGYHVLFIAETATELISSGVSPWTCRDISEYEKYQLKLQLYKEEVYDEVINAMDHEKILLVCDRGCLDNKAYVTEEAFQAALDYVKETEESLLRRYDAIYHLETAAKGAEEYYTTANNSSRTETAQEAVDLDDKLIDCWKNHPYLRIIDNSQSFDGKMKKLIDEIEAFLDCQKKE